MPYRDDPNSDDSDEGDGYQFARQETSNVKKKKKAKSKSKKSRTRDRKRELEEQIRNSMQTLHSPVKERASIGLPGGSSSHYQSTPYQSGGERTDGGSSETSSSHHHPAQYSSSRNHVTNAPLPSNFNDHHNASPGIVDSLMQCVGAAIRVGASEISQQPSALYQSIRSVVVGSTAPASSSSSISSRTSVPSFTPSYQQPQGSYQTVDIPSYHQAGPRPGM